jgi:hypothetical protein
MNGSFKPVGYGDGYRYGYGYSPRPRRFIPGARR